MMRGGEVETPGEPTRGRTVSLIRRAQRGSHRAFSALAARCNSRILRMVRRRLGPGLRTQVDSGDVAQEVWVETLASLERFEPRDERSFDPWLRTLVENRIRNLSRHQSRRPMRWVGTGTLDANQAPETESAEEIDLEPEIAKLSAPQREAWRMRHVEELSYREIGRRMGRSEAAVSMLLTRARSSLLRSLVRRR